MNDTNIKIHPISKDPASKNDGPIGKEYGQLSLDIFHLEKEIVIMAPIAGVKEEDITISITDDVLVIKGSRQNKFEVPEENYYTRECFWGSFSRSIVLPQEADTRGISAKFDNNVLEIHIPRTEMEPTKVIKING
ncbi:MAG: Hsp20/alpha crystallin family protein [Candidatus Gracilibacteria bacterium]|jgi:HSP20 family protein